MKKIIHPLAAPPCPLLRWATFLGLAVLLLSSPATAIFMKKITTLRRGMLRHTDQRVKLMNQLLVGIRVLKMYAWEAAQEAAVSRPAHTMPQRTAARVQGILGVCGVGPRRCAPKVSGRPFLEMARSRVRSRRARSRVRRAPAPAPQPQRRSYLPLHGRACV